MKHFATVLIFLFLNLSFGQDSLNGIWIGKNLEYLSINDSLVSVEFRTLQDGFKYIIKNNQLILIKNYEVSRANGDSFYFVADSTQYYFDYKLLSKDSLQLKLNKIIGRNLSSPKKLYNYNRKSSLKTSEINFQSLFFRGSSCFGSCPKMKIEIDSLGNAKFKGESYTKPFIGNYIGKLTSKQLELLVEILNRSQLNRFPENLLYLIDAQSYRFIFRYDNKEIKSGGSQVPYFNREILIYLLSIYKEVEWTEVEYEIEFSE
jgi:hypothetical protein